MIKQGYFDQGFMDDKRVIADCFRAMGMNVIARDVENETSFELIKTYAHCALRFLMRDKLWDFADLLLARGIILRK